MAPLIGKRREIQCPIWQTPAEFVSGDPTSRMLVDSSRTAGSYWISDTALELVQRWDEDAKGDEYRARLTSWLIDQRRNGVIPYVNSKIVEYLPSTRYTFSDRERRFFLALLSIEFRPSDQIRVTTYEGTGPNYSNDLLLAWLGFNDMNDVVAYLSAFAEMGLLTTDMAAGGVYMLTGLGLVKLDEYAATSINSDQAFVAMWFSSLTSAAFDQGMKPAIEAAGYSAMRIDNKHHNNRIDAEIISEIRRSRFLIADFTSEITTIGDKPQAIARGGVYFEAGFALGLNLPVIWTVHSSCLDHLHFDTRQYAHLVWSNPEDLKKALYDRIGASAEIGFSPNAMRLQG